METFAQSALLFLVLPVLSPGVSILILSGVFIFQLPKDCALLLEKCKRKCTGYRQIENEECIYLKFIAKCIGVSLYFGGGVIFFIILIIKSNKEHGIPHVPAMLFGFFSLSIIWFNCVQEVIAKPRNITKNSDANARYKSSKCFGVKVQCMTEQHY